MTLGKIRWIIGLMTLAVLGIIGFQGYWISQALKANEQRFKNEVYQALTRVSQQMEQQAASQRFNDIIKNQFAQEEEILNAMRDSLNRAVPPAPGSTSPPVLELDTVNKRGEQGFWFSFRSGDSQQMQQWQAQHQEQMQRLQQSLQRKSEMLSGLFQQWLTEPFRSPGMPEKEEVDSLLKTELQNRGIDLSYQFKVTPQPVRVVPHAKEVGFRTSSFMQIPLHPNEFMRPAAYLSIYFPNKYGYILQKTWFTLIASLLLLGVIIYSFWYAISTILRQKKLSEVKNDFINNMTHEFKTPISTVSLACEALRDEDLRKNEAFYQKYLGIIGEENKRLGLQVEKVLQIAALDKQDFKLKNELLDIHDVIERVLSGMKIQAENKDGALEKRLKAENAMVLGDRVHLSNIINNLVDNALKYSGENPHVEVETQNKDGVLQISVRDHGIGIKKEDQAYIFDKFYRIPTGNLHDVKGFGLGLSYVKTMVLAHQGTISVQSTPGHGSTFIITLPLGK